MNRTTRRLALPGALLGLLALQVAFLEWQRRQLTLPGPAIGGMLPDMSVSLLADGGVRSLGSLLTGGQPCSVLVLAVTDCPICRRMRYTWPRAFRAWSDSIGVPVQAIWISPDDSQRLRGFYKGLDFSGVVLARTTPENWGPALGVYATPTTYLLDRDGRLRIGVWGNQFPPAMVARAACGRAAVGGD